MKDPSGFRRVQNQKGSKRVSKSYFLVALIFAHRALAAAAIFALAARLIFRLLRGACVAEPLAVPALPSNRCKSRSNVSILSLMFAAFRSCFDVSSIIVV